VAFKIKYRIERKSKLNLDLKVMLCFFAQNVNIAKYDKKLIFSKRLFTLCEVVEDIFFRVFRNLNDFFILEMLDILYCLEHNHQLI
jgi:hypothetical protein